MDVILSETQALNKALQAPKLDPVMLSIANRYLEGSDMTEISREFNISTDLVVEVVEKPEVKKYIDSVFLSQGYLHRKKRLDLINRVIEHKLQEAEETEVFSKKDLLDWLKHLNTMEKTARPDNARGPAVGIQINNYDKFMKDVLDV